MTDSAPIDAPTFDLSDILTELAREAYRLAAQRGVRFFFDYQGPSFDVGGFRKALAQAITPMLAHTVGRLEKGACVFLLAEVVPHKPGSSLLVQVADTSTREVSAQELGQLAARQLEGSLVMGQAPGEGKVVRLDLALPMEGETEDLTFAHAHGHRALVIGHATVLLDALAGRLQRLGWTSTVMAAELTPARMAGLVEQSPLLVVWVEPLSCPPASLADLRQRLPAATFALATSQGIDDASCGPPADELQRFTLPFSPRQLWRLSNMALAVANKRLRPITHPLMEDAPARPKVLLVDDNLINQLLSTEILKLFGFDVELANHGKEAVEHCAQSPPALIIMDIDMPIMDGFEATVRIREMERSRKLPRVPIIAATAQNADEYRERALEAGMDGYLEKPLDIETMRREIHKVLRGRNATNPRRSTKEMT